MDVGAIAADDLPRIASVLHQQTTRLTRLVDDLGQLARLEAREFTLTPEPVELAAHLREQAEAITPVAETARIRFAAEFGDVGSGLVDPDRVGQIVGNLLDNPIRWTPEGGAVTLRLTGGNGVVRIAVFDTGPGIEVADLPHIFDRAYTTARLRPLRDHGSGLGLAIVRELASAMGGTAVA